jgi:hypothetical protein
MIGQGAVMRQDPPAGTPVGAAMTVRLHLTSPATIAIANPGPAISRDRPAPLSPPLETTGDGDQ